jgi:hypothetical protein
MCACANGSGPLRPDQLIANGVRPGGRCSDAWLYCALLPGLSRPGSSARKSEQTQGEQALASKTRAGRRTGPKKYKKAPDLRSLPPGCVMRAGWPISENARAAWWAGRRRNGPPACPGRELGMAGYMCSFPYVWKCIWLIQFRLGEQRKSPRAIGALRATAGHTIKTVTISPIRYAFGTDRRIASRMCPALVGRARIACGVLLARSAYGNNFH